MSHPRPRPVTTAAIMGVVGSVLLVLSLFDALQRIRTVEMRSAVEEFLAEPPGDGLGVGADWVLDLLHVLVLVNGALAAVTAVLAVYVMQRHQAARVGFTVAAALLLFTAPLSGGVMAMVVAFAATMLWSRPARDWFAGRPPAPAAVPAARPAAGSEDGQDAGQPRPTWSAPVATLDPDAGDPAAPAGPRDPAERPGPASYPFGSTPDPGWAPPAYGQQPQAPTWARGTAQDPDRRPGQVTAAAVVTWVFAGVTTLVYLLVTAMLMFAKDALVDAIQADPQFEGLPVSTADLLALLWVLSAVSIFWSVSAFVLAVLVFRRFNGARWALVVSSAGTLLVSLLAFPVGVVHALAAAVVLGLLLSRRSATWFSRRPARQPPTGPWAGPPGDGHSGYGPPAPPPGQPGQPRQPSGRQKPPVW